MKTVKKELHPFVKWAGGKKQLLHDLVALMPPKYGQYYEPFVGGGALLFKVKPKHFVINDINSDLIAAYRCFTNEKDYQELTSFLEQYEKQHSEEYYYHVRNQELIDDYQSESQRAARFIYLNKSCFNGLYRVNSHGYFNVPSGHKKKVICFDRDNFCSLFDFFKGKNIISNEDFSEAVKGAKKGDFVYFDPPYDVIENKSSFTHYHKDDFGREEQIRLAKLFQELDRNGVYVMLSNHNTEFIRELYRDFHIHVVNAKRAINSDGKKRGEVEEVIITNYA